MVIRCGQCRHGGQQWRDAVRLNLHCEHPDVAVSGKRGWDSVRAWYESCEHGEVRVKNPEVKI